MMRFLSTYLLCLALPLLSACPGKPEPADCPDGHARSGPSCEPLCRADHECPTGQACGAAGVCVLQSVAGPPRIDSVNGDGSPDGRPGHGANRIGSALVMTGANLLGAALTLTAVDVAKPTITHLATRKASDTDLVAELPADTRPGSYLLQASNVAGVDAATVTVLQGEPGTCGPESCPTGTAAVPIGTVIDWWRPNGTVAVPAGYVVCEGQVLADPQSPLNGATLPNVTAPEGMMKLIRVK